MLLLNGKPVVPKSRIDIEPGSIIVLHEAGGGGFGDPNQRTVSQIRGDLYAGLITHSYIRKHYPLQSAAFASADVDPSPDASATAGLVG